MMGQCRVLTVLLCGGLLLIWKLASAAPPVANDAKTNKDATASEDRATKSNKKTRSADKTAGKDDDPKPEKVVKTDAEWRKILTPMQFKVTRKKFTEQAGTGRYAHWKKDGIYHCVCCGEPLFDSKTKFESGTGWPSFFQAINEEAITELEDTSDGVVRTEVQCSRCDAHLGHVFADGPGPTGLRFCMNSAALKFVDRHKEHAGKDVKSVQHHGVTTGGATTGAEGKAKESKNLE